MKSESLPKQETLENKENQSEEKETEQGEKSKTPQSLIEKKLNQFDQNQEKGSSTEIARQTLQDVLETIKPDEQEKDGDQELNLFIAYQGIKEVEQYLQSEDDFGFAEIKNSLAKQLGEQRGIDIQPEEEIGEMVDLDEKLETAKERLKQTPDSEKANQEEEFKNYLVLNQEIKKRQQEIMGEQQSFYNQYSKKIASYFEKLGSKIDNWAINNKVLKFIGEKGLTSKTMKTAAAGIIAFGAIGGILNPDSAEAAESENELEAQKQNFIEYMRQAGMTPEQAEEAYQKQLENVLRSSESQEKLSEKENFIEQMKNQGIPRDVAEQSYEKRKAMVENFNTDQQKEHQEKIEDNEDEKIKFEVGDGAVYEKSPEEGENDLIELARTKHLEDSWLRCGDRWVDVGGAMAANITLAHINNELMNKLGADNPEFKERETIYDYHIHPFKIDYMKFFNSAGGIRPMVPSLTDLNSYVLQTEEARDIKMNFEGRIADLTGIWKVKEIDESKTGPILNENNEPTDFGKAYRELYSKYINAKNFSLENIDNFIEEAKKIGLSLEYEIKREEDLKNGKEGLKRIAKEYLETNKVELDKLPPEMANCFKNILETEEKTPETKEVNYTPEEETIYQNNLNLIAEHDDLSDLKNDNWQGFLENKTLGDLMKILNKDFENSNQIKEIDLDTAKKLSDFLKPHLESNNPFPRDTLLKDVISEINV